MRILRNGDGQSGAKLLDCNLYVRKDLNVAWASEWFYVFVGENSYLSLLACLAPEDGE